MPPETMKLILLFCTIILATHHTAAVADEQDYAAAVPQGSDEDPNQVPLQRHIRSDGNDIEARRRSSLDKNFMRFGRADKNILRFGRSSPKNILRFGRNDGNFMRFGRNDGNFMRFGRTDGANHARLGRPDNNFIRFGRTSEFIGPPVEGAERRKKGKDMETEWNDGKKVENFMRFGRNQKTNFIRLGRSDDKGAPKQTPQTKNILRFGRADNFLRFGRSETSPDVSNADDAPEEVPEDVKSFLDALPALAEEEFLVFPPPNYLIPKEDDN